MLLEHPGPWSHDILDGGTFGPAATERFQQLDCGLFLIRKPGRTGRKLGETRTLYLVFCQSAVVEQYQVSSLEEVFSFDLSGPAKNPDRCGETLDQPLLLVCTHSKRDRCCAIKGRPIAQALVQEFPTAPIWECSHTKGHRFAPSALLFPWGYFYGRLNIVATVDLYRHALAGRLFVPGLRGRGIYGPQDQVAEVAVAHQLVNAGEQLGLLDLSVGPGYQVRHKDGRSWIVNLRQREIDGVISSCGDAPKVGKIWEAEAIIDA